jgi:hypothetical protein
MMIEAAFGRADEGEGQAILDIGSSRSGALRRANERPHHVTAFSFWCDGFPLSGGTRLAFNH